MLRGARRAGGVEYARHIRTRLRELVLGIVAV